MSEPIIKLKEFGPRLESDYAEFLRGKSMAIVGRAGLDDLRQQEKIDSYDVVVRQHNAVPYTEDPTLEVDDSKRDWPNEPFVPELWQSRIGTKTSIYFHKIMGGGEDWHKHVVRSFRAAGGAFFCVEREANCWHVDSTKIWKQIPVRYLTLEHYLNTALLTGGKPLAGTLIVCDILRYPVKNVYLTGFPCWIDDKGHVTNKQDLDRYRLEPWRDFNFLKRLSYNEPRVEVDPYMQSLFDRYGVFVSPQPQPFNTTPHSLNADYII